MRPFQSSRLLRAFAALALACVFMVPGIAIAAPLNTFWQSGTITMTNLSVDSTPTLIITLRLDNAVRLPTSGPIAVPIPNGAKANWAGEILGTADSDVAAKDAKLVIRGGRSYVTFTMTKSREAQVECTPPPGWVSKDRRSIRVGWTAADTLGPVYLNVFVPTGFAATSASKITSISPQPDGTLYVHRIASLSPGRTGTFKMSLVASETPAGVSKTATEAAAVASATAAAPVVPAAVVTPPASPMTIVIWVLLLLLVVAVVVVVIIARQMRSRS